MAMMKSKRGGIIRRVLGSSSSIITVVTFLCSTLSLGSSAFSLSSSSSSSLPAGMSTSTVSTSEQTPLPPPFRLGYATDVEGNIDYFLRYVEKSNVLTVLEYSNQSLVLDLQNPTASYFVFGGDSVDKGPGDIRLVRALVDLKRRYPDRVYLLVGNRDLNKLRFSAELSPEDLARPIEEIPPPHWDPSAPTLKEYLQKKQQQEELAGKTLEELDTRLNRLQYMLKHTLGCPQTFEFRRQELALMQNKDITDEEVVENFVYEIQDPRGSLRQYLECADIAVVIGNTLFCHGAVDSRTMKFIPREDTKFCNPPSKPPPAAMIDNVHEWVEALNEYLKKGLDDHRNRPIFNTDRTSRGGESLMAIQNRPAMWGRSIVCNCYGDGGVIHTKYAVEERLDPERVALEATQPLVFEKVCSDPFDQVVADWLKKDNIQRVVVGHKPTGDCPAVLSALYTGVEIVSADTSFSDISADDNRGKAMSVVELEGTSSTDNQLIMRGILRDGNDYECRFCRLHQDGIDASVGDASLGRQIEEEYSVKAATLKETYWLSRGSNRNVEYKEIEKTKVLEQLRETTVQCGL